MQKNDKTKMTIVVVGILFCAVFGTCAAPLRGPEAWLEFMGGNVRKAILGGKKRAF